jgi:stearoyl-CoA desaturase (delta-9 desaturase)
VIPLLSNSALGLLDPDDAASPGLALRRHAVVAVTFALLRVQAISEWRWLRHQTKVRRLGLDPSTTMFASEHIDQFICPTLNASTPVRRLEMGASDKVPACMHSLYGLIRLSTLGYVAFTFAMVQLMLLGVTLYLHRDQSHGGLRLHAAVRHFFRFWLWFSSSTVTKEWVAVHRRHHVFADQPGDPHSPVVFGLKRVLAEGYELYAEAAHDPDTLAHYGRGTPDDWLERHLYSRFPRLGIVMFIIIQLISFGVPAIAMLGVQLIAQPLLAAGIINGLGHRLGYRSFELPTAATNIVPWGLLIAGEELHNNHHAFPSSPRFSIQRWEFDVGWLWICILRGLGLASVSHLTPIPTRVKQCATFDFVTARTLFANRQHVLRDYRRQVLSPVLRDLTRRKGLSVLPRQTSKLLTRHPTRLNDAGRQQLGELLEQHGVLRTVFDFRARMQKIWDETSAGHDIALDRWVLFCDQAGRSNIRALREFAMRLPEYRTSSMAA